MTAWQVPSFEEALRVLDQVRMDSDVTHTEWARRIGAARSEVDRWRSGERVPRASRFWDAAHALEYDVVLVSRQRIS